MTTEQPRHLPSEASLVRKILLDFQGFHVIPNDRTHQHIIHHSPCYQSTLVAGAKTNHDTHWLPAHVTILTPATLSNVTFHPP